MSERCEGGPVYRGAEWITYMYTILPYFNVRLDPSDRKYFTAIYFSL